MKAANAMPSDGFGACVALNGDGLVLAVGAPQEDIGGDQTDESRSSAGAVYMD